MDYYAKPEVMVFVFLAVGAIALYSYLSINSYVNGRRKEREAYYKNETVRRLTESAGAGADAAIALLREEDRLQTRRRLEGTKLGGLITTAVGIGFSFLHRSSICSYFPVPVWPVTFAPPCCWRDNTQSFAYSL